MSVPITVVIPVGPAEHDKRWLDRCLDSVLAQTERASVVLVDDMAGLKGRGDIFVYRPPWHLGVANAFNAGVAVAPTEWALLLGADDWLEPDAVALAWASIEKAGIEQAYCWFRVRYDDDRPEPDQAQPCNAAVVSKALWRHTGGLPVEAGVGRGDVMFIGMLMGHPEVGTLVPIADNGRPLYNVHVHEHQHTASRGPWLRALEETAQAYWTTWAPPRWGRYE